MQNKKKSDRFSFLKSKKTKKESFQKKSDGSNYLSFFFKPFLEVFLYSNKFKRAVADLLPNKINILKIATKTNKKKIGIKKQ
jgi:hypothetical protein